jgi:hypothetical protein
MSDRDRDRAVVVVAVAKTMEGCEASGCGVNCCREARRIVVRESGEKKVRSSLTHRTIGEKQITKT